MSFAVQARMAQDQGLMLRIAAAVAAAGVVNATEIAKKVMWPLVTTAGWADAYALAPASDGLTTPGTRDDVITDQMITAAVAALAPRLPAGAGVIRLTN